MTQTPSLSALTSEYSAHNYAPLPVVVAEAAGAWVTDAGGRRYLDMLAGYSALNFGHRHPRLVAAAVRQLGRVTLVSRAFDHDQFGPFCAELADLCGMEMVLPMNTGVEAVETAVKVARKWGYEVRGVPRDEALIVVFDGNFHGRTGAVGFPGGGLPPAASVAASRRGIRRVGPGTVGWRDVQDAIGAGRLRAAGHPRGAGQGDARLHDPARSTARHHRGGPGLGPGPLRGSGPGRPVIAAVTAASGQVARRSARRVANAVQSRLGVAQARMICSYSPASALKSRRADVPDQGSCHPPGGQR